MKRWNGWGDVNHTYPFPPSAADYLTTLVGEGTSYPDAALESVIASVPPSQIPEQPLITTDAEQRLYHARGQSLPDWIALRSGRIGAFPDGVAYPASAEEVRTLLQFARRTETQLIPYGGGTSVVGHINPLPGGRPVLTVDLSRLNRLEYLDQTSRLATFGAGVTGPYLEAQLRPFNLTLGHFPQSFEYSTLGGWIATRSSGQQSYYYGRIESLFAGGQIETPLDSLQIAPHPASAAGPDLRELILGSEGRLGIITQATVRVRPIPESETFQAAFFHDWASGVKAVREIAQDGIPVSMLRLNNAQETETTLALAGKEQLVAWADRGLRLLCYGPERCLLLFGLTGEQPLTKTAEKMTKAIIRANGGLPTGGTIGRLWEKARFDTPYLRNTLWEAGYAIDTLETAVPWDAVHDTAADIQTAINQAIVDTGERVLILTHLSHVYNDGASIYVTYLFRRTADPEQLLHRWQAMKSAASQAIVAHKGTISHQHGVGIDHAPYLTAEIGELGIEWLSAMCKTADPDGMLNPGKLLPAQDNGQTRGESQEVSHVDTRLAPQAVD
ncbi:MAG: FAD-binding oxidoreductase [Candidatus Promineifilaceae bacterium]